MTIWNWLCINSVILSILAVWNAVCFFLAAREIRRLRAAIGKHQEVKAWDADLDDEALYACLPKGGRYAAQS